MSRLPFPEPARAALLLVALLLLAPAVAATPASAIVPLGQFGQGPGDQAGLLDSPRGVALDGDGRLYVSEGERISVFSPQGAFLRAFGKNVVPGNARTGFEQCTTICQAGERGGDSGEFANAHGLAVDAEGLLYVADEQQNRVSVFNQQGGFVRGFGKDVDSDDPGTGFEVCTLGGCQPGQAGSGPGELDGPIGLTVASNGTLFVVDAGNDRVAVYTLDGRFLRAFGRRVNRLLGGPTDVCASRCGRGIRGAGAGELNLPSAVAVDPGLNVYVSDSQNNRLSVFAPDLSFQRAYGADVIPGNGFTGFEVCTSVSGCKEGSTAVPADGPGVLNEPAGVAIGSRGRVFVSEVRNHRVSVFSPASSFLRAFGKDVIPDNAGAGFEECLATCKAAAFGAGRGELSAPLGVTSDCRGAIYVADRFNGRAQRFGARGTDSPPCTDAPALAKPFGIMRARRHPSRGTATLTISIPWSAGLKLRGRGVVAVDRQAEFPGRTRLAVRPRGAVKRRLDRRGRARVKVRVTYWPWGGRPRSKSRTLELRKR